MGIGLSAQGVNMNRLPGWDKHSYGYHGDDGHSFCSSGSGQPYGPTFTTNDVIGRLTQHFFFFLHKTEIHFKILKLICRLRSEPDRQHLLLHEERPQPGHGVHRPTVQLVPDGRPTNAGRNCGHQLRSESIRLRHCGRHEGTEGSRCVHHSQLSDSRQAGPLGSFVAKVSFSI